MSGMTIEEKKRRALELLAREGLIGIGGSSFNLMSTDEDTEAFTSASVDDSEPPNKEESVEEKKRRALALLESEGLLGFGGASITALSAGDDAEGSVTTSAAGDSESIEDKKRRALALLQAEGLGSFGGAISSMSTEEDDQEFTSAGAGDGETLEEKKKRALELLRREGLIGDNWGGL